MPIDLTGAVVAWLVAVCGDTGIRLIRGSPDKRLLLEAVDVAVSAVVVQADPVLREPLRAGLAWCFSGPPQFVPDGSARLDDLLKAAVGRQIERLDNWVDHGTGRSFYQQVPVSQRWLTSEVTKAVVQALRQVVAKSSPAELVHGLDTADMLARLDALLWQMRELVEPYPARTDQIAVETVQRSGVPVVDAASRRDEWVDAVMAFIDIEDPEFRRAVLRRMGDLLGLDHSFMTSYRPVARDHVVEIVARCWDFRDRNAALAALADALTTLRPDDRASDGIRHIPGIS
jgi:Effector-associated domain 2